MTAADVAQLLKVSTQTLANWRSSGQGPNFHKVGGSVRYELADIKEFVAKGRAA
ncbi:MAG: DNA-binding protein [Methylophaga sp.]|nr:DNA-binding protein [Methylophaga sp.]MAY18405.1 DNA-binding protein [Methylophaga sp.]MBN46618.1 DNA-binding protein [Methylophaga sp.]THK41180.1 helix-turn-helix domain-containing protein [Methylophaga sp. SB9B]HCD06458.1 DNA-binding protein [Methylophaga sp.]